MGNSTQNLENDHIYVLKLIDMMRALADYIKRINQLALFYKV
jgi:hypothetical protein